MEGKREGQPPCDQHAQDVGVSKAHQPHGLGLKLQPPLCPDWWAQNLGTEAQCSCTGRSPGCVQWSDQGRRVWSGSCECPGGQIPTVSSLP